MNKRAELSTTALATIIVILVLGGIYGLFVVFSNTSLSVVDLPEGTCVMFEDVNGNNYASFDEMRAENSDLTQITNEQFESYGFKQTDSGVEQCN